MIGFPVKTAHSFQVQAWELGVGKMKEKCDAHCMQVAKVACFAAEEKEELAVGKQLWVDMMMALQVKGVFA